MRRQQSGLLWLLLCLLLSPALALAAAEVPLRVEITGIEGRLLENVRAFLSILDPLEDEGGVLGTVTETIGLSEEEDEEPLTEYRIRQLHEQAAEEIRMALRPFGYYDARVDASLEKIEGEWVATYRVDPGRPTRLSEVEIRVEGEGRNDPAIRTALQQIDLAKGQILSHPGYEQAKSLLVQTAYGAGYLDARLTRSEIRVLAERRSAEIHLVLETGEQYYFGDVDIRQDILDPDFVHRFVDIEPGDPFDTRALIDLQLALRDSAYFSTVELSADKDKAENQRVPVMVRTEPTQPQKYRFSLGYGTDTGPRVGVGVLFRRVNRQGHQIRLDAQVSAIKTNASAQYKIPVGNVATDFVDFTAGIEQISLNDIESQQYAIGTSLNDGWYGGRRRLYLSLEREIYTFGDGPSQQSDLLIPGFVYTRTRADDLLFTREGYSLTTDVHGATERLLSDTTFAQGRVDLRAVYPLAERARLLLHLEYGATTVSDFSELPPSQRFFAGGSRSVRGYGYQKLAPENADGAIVGGRYLAVASVELDYLFYGNFGGAVFFDAGNAGNDPLPEPKLGVGIGFRYRSPIGMIRLDVAHPLDDPDKSYRIHISIGPDL